MPHRTFSAMIIGGAWPSTDPAMWSDSADGLRRKATELVQDSTAIRHTATSLPASDQMGSGVDGFINSAYKSSMLLSQHGELYGNMATAADEVARTIYGLREDLDKIDSEAHEEIRRLEEQARRMNHPGVAAALHAAITEVIAKARAAATAAAAAAAGHISGELTRFEAGTPPTSGTQPGNSGANPAAGTSGAQQLGFGGGGGGPGSPGRDGMPEGGGHFGPPAEGPQHNGSPGLSGDHQGGGSGTGTKGGAGSNGGHSETGQPLGEGHQTGGSGGNGGFSDPLSSDADGVNTPGGSKVACRTPIKRCSSVPDRARVHSYLRQIWPAQGAVALRQRSEALQAAQVLSRCRPHPA